METLNPMLFFARPHRGVLMPWPAGQARYPPAPATRTLPYLADAHIPRLYWSERDGPFPGSSVDRKAVDN